LWLLLTIVLGLAFLGIKGWEYYQKYRVGLMPLPGEQQIFNQADYTYVAAVKHRLQDNIDQLERRKDRNNRLTEAEQERLLMLYDLKEHMAEFTARVAGTSDDSWYAQISMNLMAHQIMRHPDTSRRIEEILEPEMRELERRLARDAQRLELVASREKLVILQMAGLQKEIEQMGLLNPDGEDEQSQQEKQEWLEAKQRQSTNLKAELERMRNNIRPLIGRICHLLNDVQPPDAKGEYFRTDKPEVLFRRLQEAALEAESAALSAGQDIGLNEKYGLRLPVVITNGQQWMSMYLLLTGIHALHVIAGLLVFFWYLPRKLNRKKAPALYVACMYWQFVDFVWLLIFWLIYF
ncbi:MAG: cytochrome c oxidase subunit 3, partial [Pirellulaceae bacterium]